MVSRIHLLAVPNCGRFSRQGRRFLPESSAARQFRGWEVSVGGWGRERDIPACLRGWRPPGLRRKRTISQKSQSLLELRAATKQNSRPPSMVIGVRQSGESDGVI